MGEAVHKSMAMLAAASLASHLLLVVPAQAAKPAPLPDLAEYSMPEAVLDVEVRTELKSCRYDAADGYSFVTKRTVTLAPRAVADPALRYPISTAGLVNARSKVEATFAFHDSGALKSINATSEDRTGAIISGLLGIVTNVIKIGALGLASPAAAAESCDQIAPFKERALYLTRLEAVRAAIRDLDPADPKLGEKTKALQERYQGLQAQLTQYVDENLVFTTKATFTPQRDVRVLPLMVGLDLLKQKLGLTESSATRVQSALGLQLLVRPSRDLGPAVDAPTTLEAQTGIVLRTPMRATAFVCERACTIPADYPRSPVKALQSLDFDAPQFGEFSILPVRTRIFESRTVALGMSPFGRVDSLTFKSGSRIENAVTAGSDISAKLLTALTEREDAGGARETARLKAEKALLDAQREVIEARRKLAETRGDE